MNKNTLVIILSSINNLTNFNNFKKNLIDELNADLCLCSLNEYQDIDNEFYKLAKYKFAANMNIEEAYDYAQNTIYSNMPIYEKINNINPMHGKIMNIKQTTENITYYGNNNKDISDFSIFNDNEIIAHFKDFNQELFKNDIYGIKNGNTFINEENVIIYKKRLHWKEFINNITCDNGIFLFLKWYLLNKDIIKDYDRFIITNTDLIYELPHPKLCYLNENCIWMYNNSHVVLGKNNIVDYFNLLNDIFKNSNQLFYQLNERSIEQIINYFINDKFYFLIKDFPPIFDANYKNKFETSGIYIDDFYSKNIAIRKTYTESTTPLPLYTLDNSILDIFMKDMCIFDKYAFLNGVNVCSRNQIPEICYNYMNYINSHYEIIWSKEMIDEMLNYCNKSEYIKLSPNDYPNSSLQFVKAFSSFVDLTNKDCLVLGSISPWIECLAIYFNAKSVTTLDYIKPICNYKINILSMDELKKDMKFDVILSFSSLEHDGLGRYGDPINPQGDIDACIEVHSLLNIGGYFLCGIPIGIGAIHGNFHRIYNKKRIDKLFKFFYIYSKYKQ